MHKFHFLILKTCNNNNTHSAHVGELYNKFSVYNPVTHHNIIIIITAVICSVACHTHQSDLCADEDVRHRASGNETFQRNLAEGLGAVRVLCSRRACVRARGALPAECGNTHRSAPISVRQIISAPHQNISFDITLYYYKALAYILYSILLNANVNIIINTQACMIKILKKYHNNFVTKSTYKDVLCNTIFEKRKRYFNVNQKRKCL